MNSSILLDRLSTFLGKHNRPLYLSFTTCLQPGTSVQIIGLPIEAASSKNLGSPSL